MSDTHFDVVISGYGPTGQIAANLLGLYGLSTLVIEKEKDIYPYPRAVVIDDEITRVFQNIGLLDELLAKSKASKAYKFVNQNKEVLFAFKRDVISKNGFPYTLLIYQPEVEKILRTGVKRFQNVEVRLEHRLEKTDLDDNHVVAHIRNLQNGQIQQIKAKYLLVCEGASSPTRKAFHVELNDLKFDHRWLVVDTIARIKLPLPEYNQQFCNPERPTSYICLGNNRYRWEIKLHDDEMPNNVASEEEIRSILAYWADPEQLAIERFAIYTFHALIAKTWRIGPVFFLGDAAHQTPPFLGQGLCAGIRDAHNLCWKLKMVVEGHATPKLLDTYESERKPHVTHLIEKAVLLGEIIQVQDPALAAFRDKLFAVLHSFTNVHQALSNVERSIPVIGKGFHKERDNPVLGHLFIQPKVLASSPKEVLLDDLLHPGFALISLNQPAETWISEQNKTILHQFGIQCLTAVSPGFTNDTPTDDQTVWDLTGELTDWFKTHRYDYVLLRPDRYIYGGGTFANINEEIREFIHQLKATG